MPELDLVFCCDCTGSMGQYIQSAQDNIRTIATQIRERASAATSIRFALVMYRDHPPQDTSYVTRVCPFVEDVVAMKAYVDQMAASGGGDGPEAVSAALAEVDKMPWRPNATKVCVLIADAPPHGLGESDDGFPEGCPMGTDPVVTCKSLAAKSVIIYSVGVEPCLSLNYKYARDFMMMVAQVTEGRYLPLGRAEILTEVIVSGALEGISLDALWAKVEAEVQEANKGRDVAETEFLAMVSEGVKEGAKGVQTAQMEVDNPYLNDQYNMHNCFAFAKEESLAAARKKLDANANAHVQQQVQQYQWAQQPSMAGGFAQMTEQQSSRCAMRGMKAKGYF